MIRHIGASVIMSLRIDRFPHQRRIRSRLFPIERFFAATRAAAVSCSVTPGCEHLIAFYLRRRSSAYCASLRIVMDAIRNAYPVHPCAPPRNTTTAVPSQSTEQRRRSPRSSATRAEANSGGRSSHAGLQPTRARIPRRLRLLRQVRLRWPNVLSDRNAGNQQKTPAEAGSGSSVRGVWRRRQDARNS